MKKPITILTILVMLLSLSFIFSSCGNKCEHTYDNACDATCNECGEERTITHTPSADDGDCTTPITCSVCKTVTTPAKDSHTGGTATCTEKAVCTVCGTAYGTVDGDNHIDENTDHICDRECGKTDIGIHADSAEDNDHACDYGCGAALEEHRGGTATCKTQAVCEVCGASYGEFDPNNHEYEKNNGICCDTYQPAMLNESGYYEIGNAGQLFWFANHINTEDRTASAVLVADIDLENRPWTPIGETDEAKNNFRGVFDGQNHTIKGLYVEGSKNGVGFFGEVRTGTVKNFTIYGEVVVNTEVDYVGGVIGSICGVNGENDLYRNGAEIKNITSYVNLTAKAHGVGKIGGFVGYANHESLIENCSWYGTFDAGVYRVVDGAGGFIGHICSNSNVTIRNCAAYGTIKTNYAGDYNNTPTIYMGGFLSFSNTGAGTVLENCLFAGKFERGENLTDEARLGAFGTLRSVNSIKNCYYLGDGVLEAVHSDSNLKPGSDNVEIYKVTGEELRGNTIATQLGEFWVQDVHYPILKDTTKHSDSVIYTYTDNGDGTHKKTCTECGYVVDSEPHTLTYTANINIITESCSVGCGYSETATISAKDATYDGLEHNTAIVDYSEGWKGGELTISYANNTNAGTATASITVGEATATADFTIAKAPLTVTADAKIKTYGDENPTLTYTAEGLLGGDTLSGALSGALSREEGENVGSYAITLGTLSADNYTISYEGADFTIQVKEVTDPTVTLDRDSYVYDGTAKEPKVISVIVDGRPLIEGTDYTIRYENNVYVGNYATVVINFEGNYDGTFHRWFAITQDPKTTEFYGECIGNGKLPDIHTSQNTDSSTGYDLSLPIHIYQSVPETETPAVEFVGQQLNIGGGISMKFYVRNNEDRPIESICVEVEFLGKLTYLTECEKHPTEDKVYIYTFEGITPQCLGDSMNAIILVGGIPLWHENTVLMDYSVEKNLLEIRKTADDLTVQLIDDLLAYGKAASAYKDNQTMIGTSYIENSSNREILVSEAQMADVITGYTVRFGTAMSIIIEVDPSAFGNTIYKVECNGTELRNFPSPNSPFYKVTNIAATDFDKEWKFVVRSTNPMGDVYGTFVVSVNDYLYAISQSETASAEMKALAKALYNYGVSAEAYNHVVNGVGEHTYTYIDNGDGTHIGTCVCGEKATENHRFDKYGNCACGDSVTPVSNLDELKAAVEQGGKILLTESIDVSSEELGLYLYTDFTVYLNGRTLTGDLGIFNLLRGATLTILGDGTLSVPAGNCAIGILNGTVNIAGGVIEGSIITNENGKLNIRGGQVRDVNVQKGICTVSGGEISYLYNSGTCTITYGAFGFDPAEYVDTEIYTVTDNGDGTWTVTAK